MLRHVLDPRRAFQAGLLPVHEGHEFKRARALGEQESVVFEAAVCCSR
eukprot:SAG11_NODE_28474_length_321_cov_0.864865_1_plen_47_part_01